MQHKCITYDVLIPDQFLDQIPWRMGMSWSRYSWVIAFCAGGGIAEGATTTAVEGAAAAAVVGPISGA